MSLKPSIHEFPILAHCSPCRKCGALPRKYEAPHKSACDLQYRWAGCHCTQTEPIPLGEDHDMVEAWKETNQGEVK